MPDPVRPPPLARWSRVNAVVLLVATAVALGVHDTAPYVAIGTLSFLALVLACRGRFTPNGGFGAANALTALRFGIASAVGLVPDSVPTFALGATVLGVFALDGLDGWVAKRRGESSEFGAHFDMETDAYFVLLIGLELFTRGRYGAWILVVGLLRYVYVVALAVVPARRGDKPRFTFGRHAFTGLMIGLSSGMMLGEPLASVATLIGCGLVTASFVHSFYWSYSRGKGLPDPAGNRPAAH